MTYRYAVHPPLAFNETLITEWPLTTADQPVIYIGCPDCQWTDTTDGAGKVIRRHLDEPCDQHRWTPRAE